MYDVRLSHQAERLYFQIDPRTRNRFDGVFELFERGEFRHPNIRALHGSLAGRFRYRLGSWRIIFSIDHSNQIVWIEAITKRGGAYKR